VKKFARRSQGGTDYFVLLIITDGGIKDMEQVRKKIRDQQKQKKKFPEIHT
jgi:hypothetical protein